MIDDKVEMRFRCLHLAQSIVAPGRPAWSKNEDKNHYCRK